MALADPFVLDHPVGDINLPRVASAESKSTYRLTNDDGSFTEVVIDYTRGKRNRHFIRLNGALINEDPVTELNVLNTMAVTVTVDAPQAGVPSSTVIDSVVALLSTLTATDAALLTRIVAGES